MTIENLLTERNTRVGLSLIPNGIKGDKLRFSILVGLNYHKKPGADQDKYPDITAEYLQQLGKHIQGWIGEKYLNVYINEANVQYVVDPDNKVPAFAWNTNNWKRILDGGRKSIQLFRLQVDSSDKFNFLFDKVDGGFKALKAGDSAGETKVLNEIESLESKFTTIEAGAKAFKNRFNNAKRVQASGRYRSMSLSDKFFVNAQADKELLDFNDIQTAIYKHSILAKEHYGLVINILVDQPADLSDNTIKLHLTCEPTVTGAQPDLATLTVPYEPDGQEPFKIIGQHVIDFREKYYFAKKDGKLYHGRPDFGLIAMPDRRDVVVWRNQSEIQRLNAEAVSMENTRSIPDYFGKVSQRNPSATESIIAYHNLTEDEFEARFQKEGIVGHSVVLLRTDSKRGLTKKVVSLGYREVVYDFPKSLKSLRHFEEGHITIDSSLEYEEEVVGKNVLKEYKNRELFKWEGQSLCVPKLGKRDDGSDVTKEHTDSSGVNREFGGLQDPEIDAHITKKGFTYEYRLADSSNLMLSIGYRFWFLIREVEAASNYCFPISSNNPNELTLEDLYKDKKPLGSENGQYLLKYPGAYEIDLVNNPIRPPQITGPRKYERIQKAKNFSAESDNNIILKSDSDISRTSAERLAYPPQISLQQAQQFGMLEPKLLKQKFEAKLTRREYMQRAYRLVKRSHNEIPIIARYEVVKYLADIRGSNVLVVPGSWRTRRHFPSSLLHYFEAYKYIELPAENTSNPYRDLEAMQIQVNAQDAAGISITNEGTTLKIGLQNGVEGVFRIHVMPKNSIKSKYGVTELTALRQQTPHTLFHASNLNRKPQVPVLSPNAVGETNIKAIRFDPNGELRTYIYADLKVGIDLSRKALTLLTESTFIEDNGQQIPEANKELEEEVNKRTFLNNEYPKELFEQTTGSLIDNVEETVYLNNFGVEFRISEETLNLTFAGGERAINETIFELAINNNAVLVLSRLGVDDKYRLRLRNNETGQNLEVKRMGENECFGTVVFSYSYSSSGLQLGVWTDNAKVTGNNLFDLVGLPDTGLGENRISLSKNVEEFVLYNRYGLAATDFKLDFCSFDKPKEGETEFQKNESLNHYFLYRNEGHLNFRKKKFKLRAVSKFQNSYPEFEDLEEFTSTSVNEYVITVLNNVKPEKPRIHLTPLLLQSKSLKWAKQTDSLLKQSQQNFQLMLELDRPWSDDKLALIIKQNDAVTDETCAIGRDITKYDLTSRDGKPNALSDDLKTNFAISDSLNYDMFLKKYIYKPGEKADLIDCNEYKILLLLPTFNTERNTWTAILGFDLKKQLDDPFIRIVAARYQKSSASTQLQLSDFSDPQYIPIQSQRKVDITRTRKHGGKAGKELKYKITVQKNTQSPSEKNTFYIVCLMNKEKSGLYQDRRVTLKKDEIVDNKLNLDVVSIGVVSYHLMTTSEITIDYVRCDSISVYEIEKFENPKFDELKKDLEDQKIDFLNDPRLRIIFMKEFKS